MDNTFGERLRLLRQNKRLQQKEVAIELSISPTGYSSYENGLRMPGVKMLIRIADYYNVSIDYLLGRDEKTHIDKDELEIKLKRLKNDLVAQINTIEEYIEDKK